MRVHLIKKQTIEDFVTKHSSSRAGFQIWMSILRGADWNKPSDIIQTFGSADILGNGSDRVVFNIGGNKYRLIGKYLFGESEAHLFDCWIGTHAQYDKLCNKGEQYTVSISILDEMKTIELKYKVIKSKKQYYSYCEILENLLSGSSRTAQVKEEIALLSLLIDTWDEAHNTFKDLDPIELIKGLMVEHGMKSKDMIDVLGVSKGMVSQILNKRKGLSKEVIRRIADRFNMRQESFNRPYQLVSEVNKNFRYANLMNTPKDITSKVTRKSA